MTPKDKNAQNSQSNKPKQCPSPAEIFLVANGLATLFASELNESQLNTLINLLGLLEASLSAIVTQMQICAGDEVEPPIL